MAQSGGALAYGYKNYDPELKVKGVILNNIASQRHYKLIKDSVESEPVNLEVLGYIPRQQELELPERHLGLVPTHESEKLQEFTDRLVEIIEEYINLDKLLELAGTGGKIKSKNKKLYKHESNYDVKIGIAYDKAFNFYYQYNLDLLERLGAELIYFSPVNDNKLPELDGIYLGGGFPESFLKQLSENESMKNVLKEKIDWGLPVYAECGGLMYLSREIIDKEGNKYPMVNVISATTEMKNSLQEMGYVEIKSTRDNIVLNKNEKARGHQFHYSRLEDLSRDIKYCYKLDQGGREGFSSSDNILASYVHLHFGSNPDLAQNFLDKSEKFQIEKNNI